MKLLMSSFSAEIFLWTIRQLLLNENVWNCYIHQKNVYDWQSLKKFICLKYLILETPYTFFSILSRGGSRAAATFKMERFTIIVNGWKPLTIITKHSILDVTAALDPPLFSSYFIVLHTINFLSPKFSGINNNNFSFYGFSNLSFFAFFLQL